MFRTRLITSAVIFLLLTLIFSCKRELPSDLASENIIPAPVSSASFGKWFILKKYHSVYVIGESEEAVSVGSYLAAILRPSTGYRLEVKKKIAGTALKGIILSLVPDTAGRPGEWYNLAIDRRAIRLTANAPEGLFRGVQTIRQLFQPEIEKPERQETTWRIATGSITDYPEYSYRGAMLDVSRHFFGPDDVKRYIDLICYYKMNHLHLHLSDDQGWRIEIKSWPELTNTGSKTQVGGGAGGFYTQEQYSDIVRYAAERYITIVPEIDMPGHTNAALASYPELNCDGKARDPYTGIRVGFSTLCVDKEITYKFVEDVVKEISALTPGKYFHIGGDESHSTKEGDYIKFVERVQDIVNKYGKTVIGWDEIARSKMNESSIAQYWGKAGNARIAVEQGRKVIFSPSSRVYLDMKYDSATVPGLHWAGYIEVDKSYSWDPATLIEGIGKENILGVEAPLWAETVTTIGDIEFMAFPRLPGIAEIGWTPSLKRDWLEYRERLAGHEKRFNALAINFYRSPAVPWKGTK